MVINDEKSICPNKSLSQQIYGSVSLYLNNSRSKKIYVSAKDFQDIEIGVNKFTDKDIAYFDKKV